VSCAATPFSEQRPPDAHTASFSSWWYEGDGIWAGLAPPYEGRWYAGEPALKVLWWIGDAAGELRISGNRLDGPSSVLSADIPSGYEQIGYQPSAILVPEPGCWQVVGSAGDHALRLVVDVLASELHPLRVA